MSREQERTWAACVTALAALALFTAVIWGGCAAAWSSLRQNKNQQETQWQK